MPISDEEAYRQGKRIAQDMMHGQYDPAKDYSGDSGSNSEGSTKDAIVGRITLLVLVVLIASAVFWLVFRYMTG